MKNVPNGLHRHSHPIRIVIEIIIFWSEFDLKKQHNEYLRIILYVLYKFCNSLGTYIKCKHSQVFDLLLGIGYNGYIITRYF